MTFHPPVTPSLVVAFSLLKRGRSKVKCVYPLDILIRKISLDPIGLHGQGAIVNCTSSILVYKVTHTAKRYESFKPVDIF